MRLHTLLVAVAAALLLAGCAGGDQESRDDSSFNGTGQGELTGRVEVVDNTSTKETAEDAPANRTTDG